jgi:hypothetical protein
MPDAFPHFTHGKASGIKKSTKHIYYLQLSHSSFWIMLHTPEEGIFALMASSVLAADKARDQEVYCQ